MLLIEEFIEEHQLIDLVAGALFCFAEHAADGKAESSDVADFVSFLRTFVGGYHHGREEGVLFPVLVERAEIPADRGPLATITADHHKIAAMVDELERHDDLLENASEVARKLARHIWEHVDKENSVLFPESENRLVRNGVINLEGRAPTQAEREARSLGEQLIRHFPPVDDPEMVRGDGCVACSAFAETCSGVEAEWWNSWDREYQRLLDDG